jgi:hypothetical protein
MSERQTADFRAGTPLQREAVYGRTRNRRSDEADRAYLEALLEGVPLAATHEVLVKYAKHVGPTELARELKRQPSRRYLTPDEVGEAFRATPYGRDCR